MKKIVFSMPGNEALAKTVAEKTGSEWGEITLRQFPDGETYVRALSNVEAKRTVVFCTLHQPDDKLLPLFFLSKLLKDLGAASVTLVAPYLAYMRQDKQFQPGEAVTSGYFASLLSGFTDGLLTVDPHLHRRHSMAEIYNIPCKILHASPLISKWIKENVPNPVLIGPDCESEQWVSEVAKEAGAPFTVLEKTRRGDRDVEVSVPHLEQYRHCTPVLVDDIISTARTMIETVGHLQKAGMSQPVCIGVHGVFAGNAYQDLTNAGACFVGTTNTIAHLSNVIDVSRILSEALEALFENQEAVAA